MDRRIAIKQVLVLAGGMALMPSLLKGAGRASIQLERIRADRTDEELLGRIVGMIIPKTDTPGARDMGVHLFVLKMIDDCYEKKVQDIFMKGLKSFEGMDDQVLKQKLSEVNSGQPGFSSEAKEFFRITKQQTIKGYLNSKYVMTNLMVWELVPGRYNGYFPVKA